MIGKHYEFYDKLARDIHQPPLVDQDLLFAEMVVGLMEYAIKSDKEHAILRIPESFRKI